MDRKNTIPESIWITASSSLYTILQTKNKAREEKSVLKQSKNNTIFFMIYLKVDRVPLPSFDRDF